MRHRRRPFKRRLLRASRGDASTRVAIALALAVVALAAGYVVYLIGWGSGH